MNFKKTSIDGLIIIEPKIFNDSRGYFFESYNQNLFKKDIKNINFIQDNESKSVKGVLRGFHFQNPPYEQNKLVRCVSGKVLDVALDLRKNSPTYGMFKSIILSEKNKLQFFIPIGFAHAFIVLSETAIFSYKVDNKYVPNYESGLIWNDPTLSIDWGLNKSEIIVSKKDKKLKFFSEFKSPF